MVPRTKDQLRLLSVDERLDLLEEVWASLEPDEATPLSDELRTELDHRLDHPDPRPSIDWATLRDEFRTL